MIRLGLQTGLDGLRQIIELLFQSRKNVTLFLVLPGSN
jgi:hypothetical protein